MSKFDRMFLLKLAATWAAIAAALILTACWAVGKFG